MTTYKLFTDKGGREKNEDYVEIAEKDNNYCFVLADGLGGHGKGEVAACIACDVIKQAFESDIQDDDFIAFAIQSAQDDILKRQKEDVALYDMKTTIVVLTVMDDNARWGHVGDSRLYYFKNGRLKQRTLDHSVPQMLVASKKIKETEIRKHPDRSRLLRVLGMTWESPQYVLSEIWRVRKKDAFLMCTDGFWELIDEKEMQKCLKQSRTPNEWIDKMVAVIQKNGAGTEMDNYSAIGVFVDES